MKKNEPKNFSKKAKKVKAKSCDLAPGTGEATAFPLDHITGSEIFIGSISDGIHSEPLLKPLTEREMIDLAQRHGLSMCPDPLVELRAEYLLRGLDEDPTANSDSEKSIID